MATAITSGCVAAVDGPTAGAFGTEVVDPEDLSNAAALASAANSGGRILGMALAGVAVGTIGLAPIFFVNALSYVGVIAALMSLRLTELRIARAPASSERRLRHAFSSVRQEPVILGALFMAFAAAAFGRNYQVTMAAMSDAVFRRGAGGYGLLSTVFAIGAFAGAVVAARVPRLGLRMLIGAGITAGALEIAAATMPSLGSFAACILPIALVAVLIDTAFSVVVALGVDEVVRGRALALLGVTSTAGATISGPLLGWSAEHLGGRVTLAAAGAISLAFALTVGAVLARSRPGPRHPVGTETCDMCRKTSQRNGFWLAVGVEEADRLSGVGR
jgi:MFS family permease